MVMDTFLSDSLRTPATGPSMEPYLCMAGFSQTRALFPPFQLEEEQRLRALKSQNVFFQ